MLSALGRREEALNAVEEAVGYYRALANAWPDAFNVELARSLWVLGDLYGDTLKSKLAVETLAEAIELLTPTILRIPAAMAGIMAGLGRSYVVQCQRIGREPDAKVLGPATAVFSSLKSVEAKG